MKTAIILCCLLASGCASITKPDIAFHVINTVDAVQTAQIRHYDCIVEDTFPTKEILGENPDIPETAYLFYGVSAGYQALANKYRDRKWWPFAYAAMFLAKGYYVANNQKLFDQGC